MTVKSGQFLQKRRREATEMRFEPMILRISNLEDKRNEKVLMEKERKGSLIPRIKKGQFNYLVYIMRKEENLTHIRQNDEQRESMTNLPHVYV